MTQPSKSPNPLFALALGASALLAISPACIEPVPDSFDETRANEDFPLEPIAEVEHCPKEYIYAEAETEGRLQFVCGVVVDSEGNPIEEGLEVRINGKLVTNEYKVDWRRERNLEEQPTLTLDISAPGYVPLVRKVPGSLINQPLVLQRLNLSELDPEQGGKVLDASGALIVIEPNSFVTNGGEKPEGSVTFGSFLFNPSLQDLPGDMSAINQEQELVYLESYGTMFLSATDQGGNDLQLAPGAAVTLLAPVDKRREIEVEEIPLWSFDRESAMWRPLDGMGKVFQGAALDQPEALGYGGHESPDPFAIANEVTSILPEVANHWNCTDFMTTDPCIPEHCKYVGTQGVTGEFGSLGFVNFDMEKTNPGCVLVDIDEGNVDTDEFPVCLRFEIPTAGGPIVREDCMGPSGTVLYNIPANTDIDISLLYTYGCPSGTGAGQTVNSGAPWGGVGAPSNPAGDCNGFIQLPPF